MVAAPCQAILGPVAKGKTLMLELFALTSVFRLLLHYKIVCPDY